VKLNDEDLEKETASCEELGIALVDRRMGVFHHTAD
jgi:hypothetical protein